jgi:N-acetylneuraminate synthase/N,N'-diacetyllegionaminate synthase
MSHEVQPTKSIVVGGTPIGEGHRCFVIAEAGVNHNGDLQLARELVLAAKRAGADAVKFQTFRSERIIKPDAPKAPYQIRTTDPRETQIEMLKRLELPDDWHFELADLCRAQGLIFLSTPYNFEDADFLEKVGVPAFKLASIHCAEPLFVGYVARKKRPVILATGMAELAEVSAAVRAAREVGNAQLVLLQCTTDYPSLPSDANLRAMETMRNAFQLPVGYSDHTESSTGCIAAATLGACVIEKHLTLDRGMPGPDHAASIDPSQFAALVTLIRETESVLGTGLKQPCAAERRNMNTMRRSIAARQNIKAGEVLREEMITFLRPGTGLKPQMVPELLGKRLKHAVTMGNFFSLADFEHDG